jgi:hypothetical protein
MQHDRTRGHLCAIFNNAALKVHDVANDAIVTNNGWVLWRGVDNGVVLNAGSCTNLDVPVITAEHGTWPNR